MRQVNSFIKLIGKQVSAFGKSEKLEKKISMQLNKNLFSGRHYGFPQNPCHLTCLSIDPDFVSQFQILHFSIIIFNSIHILHFIVDIT